MRKADNLQPSCAVVTKSGNLNFLEPFGPVQACNGTALHLPLPSSLQRTRFRMSVGLPFESIKRQDTENVTYCL